MGRANARNNSVSESKLRFLKGNVFQLEKLKQFGRKIEWCPNIVVASGLVEYLNDEQVQNAFKQIYEELEAGGLFLFFSQQNNPSKKLMEKVCMTNTGAWVLYYRLPTTLSEWLKNIGFCDITYAVDRWGMYNLVKARKAK